MRFRGIVVCLVILGALAIGSGYQAIRNIDVNTYRALIASQVETMTGRPVTIAGNVEVSPSLHPSIVIEQVSLAKPGWSSRPQMATVKRLELQASLLPLLAGRFEIGRVVLSGVDLLVETDGAGHRNWDFGEQAGPAGASPADLSTAPASLPSIGNIVLEDVAVTIRDGASGQSRSFHIDNLSATSEAGEDLLAISLDGSLNEQPYLVEGTVGGFARLVSKAPYPIKLAGDIAGASATLRGNIDQSSTPGVQSLDFTLSGRNLADLSKLLATDLPATGSYSLAAVIDDSADSYELRDIVLQLGGSDLSGSLTIKPQTPRWHIDGTLHAATLNLDDLRPMATASADTSGPIFPDGALSLALNGDLDGTIRFSADRLVDPALTMNTVAFDLALAEGRVDVSAFQADLAGGWLTGAASLETGAGDPQWRLQLQTRQVAAGDLLRLLSGSSIVSGGRADLAFDLRSRGRSASGLLAALTGTANADLTGGRISDDFTGLADLPSLVSFTADPDSRRLTCVAARFAIKDGIVRSNRLVVDTRDTVVAGSGQLDLRRATIAMRFKPTSKQAGGDRSAVPFDLEGPLADPDIRPDAPPPAAPANAGIAAVATTGAAVGTIAAVAPAPAAPAVSLPVEEAVISCSRGSTDTVRPPQNAAPTVTLPQNVAPAIGMKRRNFNDQADSSGANHNVGGALTPFGGSLAADDDVVKTQSATNPQ